MDDRTTFELFMKKNGVRELFPIHLVIFKTPKMVSGGRNKRYWSQNNPKMLAQPRLSEAHIATTAFSAYNLMLEKVSINILWIII